MKKVLTSFKNNKYISLLLALMLSFAYMGGTRKYIYDNCSKVFLMGFNLSIGITIFMAVAVCIGIAIMFLFRKKITMNVVVFGYGIAGIISVLALIFTPYNLQLLSPSTHMDAFAKISLIAVMVFSLITVILLSAAVSAHIMLAINNEKLIATIIISVLLVLKAILASIAVAFDWSLQIYLCVLTMLLIAFYIVNIFIKSETSNICVKEVSVNWIYLGIIIALAILVIIAVLTSSCLVVENKIKF